MLKTLLVIWDILVVFVVGFCLVGGIISFLNPDLISPHIWSDTCHQNPCRSFRWGHLTMPMCARCFGIYLGFMFGRVWLHIAKVRILHFLLILIMMIEWSLGYYVLIHTTNIIRCLTGILFGFGYCAVFHLWPQASTPNAAVKSKSSS